MLLSRARAGTPGAGRVPGNGASWWRPWSGPGSPRERLSPHDVGLELLENTVATAAALIAIIFAVGPVSGAHLNPVVTLVDRLFGGVRARGRGDLHRRPVRRGHGRVRSWPTPCSVSPWWRCRTTTGPRGHTSSPRPSPPSGSCSWSSGWSAPRRSQVAPFAVGAYIAAAYWFTSSTSFANPAVTFGAHAVELLRRASPRRRCPASSASSSWVAPWGGVHRRALPTRPRRRRRGPAPPRGRGADPRSTGRPLPVRAQRRPVADGRRAHGPRAEGRVVVLSRPAPTRPSTSTPPSCEAMAEVGVDISARRPRALTDEDARARRHHRHHGMRRQLPRLPGHSAIWTGRYPTPPARASRTCGSSATRSTASSGAGRGARRT